MQVYKIESPVVVFSHPEYGDRLLFQRGEVNSRNQLGKNGVSFHSYLGSFFYRTIAIEAEVLDPKGSKSKQIFYINRNSLIKYLGTDLKNEDLIAVLANKMIKSSNLDNPGKEDKERQSFSGQNLRHAGEHNQKKVVYSFWDATMGRFLSWLFNNTLDSLESFKARFLVVRTEKDLFDAGEVLAKARFHQAYATVPAYKEHIVRFNGKVVEQTHFRDITPTTKDNYIKYQQSDSQTHIAGKYPAQAKVDTSTGTTGKATPWVRGHRELEAVKKTLELSGKAQFGSRKLSYINAFALGPWATGLTAFEAMRNSGSVFAAGPDKEKILDEIIRIHRYEQYQLVLEVNKFRMQNPSVNEQQAQMLVAFIEEVIKAHLKYRTMNFVDLFDTQLATLGDTDKGFIQSNYDELLQLAQAMNEERSQILLAGYPPFLKELAGYVKSKGYNLSDFSLISIVGGQGMSEAMRDLLIKDGFNAIYSSYGASDLDVNLAAETDDEIFIRKAIEKHPGLARELYGVNRGLPMVFHYDPMNAHIECDDSQEGKDDLIFTITRDDRSSPRVRYNLGDKGRVYASSDVQALLAKYGIFHKPKTPLPLLFVWGRESTVVFNGANLAFTELERAIGDLDVDGRILKKAFYAYNDKNDGSDKLEFWLELNDGVELLTAEELQELSRSLFASLIDMNQDFRYQMEHLQDGEFLPTIRIFKRGESPISEAGGYRKQVLVFQKENLPENYNYPDKTKCQESTLVMSREILTQPQKTAATL